MSAFLTFWPATAILIFFVLWFLDWFERKKP